MTFSCQLDFSDKVKSRIDTRNEVNTNVTVIDQQIIEQRKRNELALLKAEENKILSSGITPQLLQKEFIIAISKSDLLDDELTEAIEKELPQNIPHIFISSAINKNLVELKDMLWKALNKPF